jgi:hypothetical protein
LSNTIEPQGTFEARLSGQGIERTEIALSEEPDEERDSKIIVIASHGT